MHNYLFDLLFLAELAYGMLDVRNPESVELVTQLTNAFCAGKNNLEPCNEALGVFEVLCKLLTFYAPRVRFMCEGSKRRN